ncbi:flavoprotein [Acidaminobacter hydrogenoformans]|uniref:Flavoprotein n=1 Tax=Acidaminobacter hydrogenoformans DSM 2784 TaxID=1120920 RepID=A0A1G5S5L2_9FIRM|nr:flavoprotein [Acidaminobacter hydrogenoformans]SCZ81634.1 Flavoprotein [Acidaminobacter hydrogenoformans DSM 2784]
MSNKELMKKVFQDMALPVFEGSSVKPVDLEASDLKDRKITVLLLGSDISMDSAFKSLVKLRESGYLLTVVMSKAAEHLVGKDTVESVVQPYRLITGDCYEGVQGLVRNTDVVILPNLTQNTLAKVAVGVQDDFPSMLLWQFLLQKVRVIVNTDSIRHAWFSIDGNPKMKKVMEGHIKTLAEYGASIIEHHDYDSVLMRDQLPASKRGSAGNSEVRPRHQKSSLTVSEETPRVITEAWLRSLSATNRQIVIEKGMMITPLAKDLAKSMGVEIVDKRQR